MPRLSSGMTAPAGSPVQPAPPLISHVSDTARWVAYYRAMETERPDAIFRDPYAERLAGERGKAIAHTMPQGLSMAWPMIVRTAVMDEIILRLVKDGVSCVLNLAAGLDARPWRLELPAGLKWIDVDHPEMIAYKTSELAGERLRCDYEAVPLDLADQPARQELFRRIGASPRIVLVITEGLLVYLRPDAVATLARDLHDQQGFHWWLMDLGSPQLLKMLEKTWGKTVKAGNAPFLFAPAENTAFFAPHGWKEAEYRAMFEESVRLGRTMRFAWFWRFVGRLMPAKKQAEFKRFSGIVLLERT